MHFLLGSAAVAALVSLSNADVIGVDLTNSWNHQPFDSSTAPLADPKEMNVHLFRRQISEITAIPSLFSYQASVSFGTPKQTFTAIFDTGSYQLWVRSTLCTSAACSGLPKYNSSASSTFSTRGQFAPKTSYVDGSSIAGVYSYETVTISSYTLNSLLFVQANSTAGISDVDAILGLSLPPVSNFPMFFDLLVSQKLVNSSVFGYYLDDTLKSGGFAFGGVDKARFTGSVSWIKLTNPDGATPASLYWSANMKSVGMDSLGTINLPGAGYSVVFDTGSSLSILPVELSDSLHNTLGFTKMSSGQSTSFSDGLILYTISCSSVTKLPKVTLNFNGASWVVNPQDIQFSMQTSSGIVCISSIAGGDLSGGNNAGVRGIIGNSLLRSVYSVWDRGNLRFGIATPIRTKGLAASFSSSDIDSSTSTPTSGAPVGGSGSGGRLSKVLGWEILAMIGTAVAIVIGV